MTETELRERIVKFTCVRVYLSVERRKHGAGAGCPAWKTWGWYLEPAVEASA